MPGDEVMNSMSSVLGRPTLVANRNLACVLLFLLLQGRASQNRPSPTKFQLLPVCWLFPYFF
jgi:hypothetical protein